VVGDESNGHIKEAQHEIIPENSWFLLLGRWLDMNCLRIGRGPLPRRRLYIPDQSDRSVCIPRPFHDPGWDFLFPRIAQARTRA
jgi:hypothetical protein